MVLLKGKTDFGAIQGYKVEPMFCAHISKILRMNVKNDIVENLTDMLFKVVVVRYSELWMKK